VALTLCGLLLAAVYCGGPMIWYARTRHVMNEMRTVTNAMRAELRERLEAGEGAEPARERMWQLYASGLYRDEGIVARMSDATGRTMAWEPTDTDIAARRSYLEVQERLQPPAGQVEAAGLWVAVCLGIGLLWPLRRAGAAGDAPAQGVGTGIAGRE
jgi:hypothetical protein